MKSPLRHDAHEYGRQGVQSALVFEGREDGRFPRPGLVLRHLRLIVVTLSNNVFRELIFGVVSGPWSEIGKA